MKHPPENYIMAAIMVFLIFAVGYIWIMESLSDANL